MQAVYKQVGDLLDYTPAVAVVAGEVIEHGNRLYVAPRPIAANAEGSLQATGVFDVAKVTGAITLDTLVYWDEDGDPVGGTAGSGALVTDAGLGTLFGRCVKAAASGDSTVRVELLDANQQGTMIPSHTVAAAGTVQADAAQLAVGFNQVTAADAAKGVRLPAAVAGLVVTIKNVNAAVLKVWPATGDKINGGAADASFSTAAAAVCFQLVAYDATDWYTLPLLPS